MAAARMENSVPDPRTSASTRETFYVPTAMAVAVCLYLYSHSVYILTILVRKANGDTCYRDSENIGRCRAGGGSPPPPTTKTTTTKTTATTTQPGTTTHSTQIQTISIATGPTSAPTAPAGSNQIVVDVSSTNITWTGSWLTVTSSCSSGKQAKKISGTASSFETGTMSYSFQGTAVYVQVASTNAYYVVVIDEVDTSYGVSGGSTPTPAS
ncbi:hypothetical protein DFH08DRAFT_323656 [Mycena albidolilacea]|uniref:Uncharacterized protein n=1 Tax=Mycena albidolilacea TaxID=1033008 RepID=A0AAD7F121_9AGAR|nr:hypothetical protein DFH08DRAFT_323656 [Mycena albidolilacea]